MLCLFVYVKTATIMRSKSVSFQTTISKKKFPIDNFFFFCGGGPQLYDKITNLLVNLCTFIVLFIYMLRNNRKVTGKFEKKQRNLIKGLLVIKGLESSVDVQESAVVIFLVSCKMEV